MIYQYLIAGIAFLALTTATMFYRGQAISAEAEMQAYKASYEAQTQTLNVMSELASSQGTQLIELHKEMSGVNAEIQRQRNEINLLRIAEQELALRQPFERGNASADRVRSILMRVNGSN